MVSERTGLDSRAFGLACGVLWSSAVVLLGLTARVGWGRRWERLLADVYLGYNETTPGLLAGGAWAFVDGSTGGFALAWLYNRLSRSGSTTPEQSTGRSRMWPATPFRSAW